MEKLKMKSKEEILSNQIVKIKEVLTILEALDIPLSILNDINTVIEKLKLTNQQP